MTRVSIDNVVFLTQCFDCGRELGAGFNPGCYCSCRRVLCKECQSFHRSDPDTDHDYAATFNVYSGDPRISNHIFYVYDRWEYWDYDEELQGELGT